MTEHELDTLLRDYGDHDSLGYFATRRDKSVVFAPSGRAAITYRVEVGVCLASGDPVGDEGHDDDDPTAASSSGLKSGTAGTAADPACSIRCC